jgi:hypothetical protein
MLLLRSFCIKTGIQILLREYNFDNKQVQTFTGTSYVILVQYRSGKNGTF